MEQAKAVPAKISYWEDDPEFPVEDWKFEVANGDTRLGYYEWVGQKRDIQKEEL